MNKTTFDVGDKVTVSLHGGTGTIQGVVELVTLNGVWVRLENGNPRLCKPSDLVIHAVEPKTNNLKRMFRGI
jgi:hypothetical protein